jgi:hypothetical protein
MPTARSPRPRGGQGDEDRQRVFISYARADRQLVDRLVPRVTAAGYPIWMDRTDIAPAQDFVEEMIRAAGASSAFVVMLSPHSVESAHVTRELVAAADAQVPLFPVLIKPCDLPAAFAQRLGNLNQIIAYGRPKAASEELVEALGGLRGAARVAASADYPAMLKNIRLIAESLRFLQEVAEGGHAIFTGGREWQAYVQFLCGEGDRIAYGEAVSNGNLPDGHQMTEAEERRLVELGWHPPAKQKRTRSKKPRAANNYFREWAARTDDDRYAIAGVAMTTLLDVYGHYPGEPVHIEFRPD